MYLYDQRLKLEGEYPQLYKHPRWETTCATSREVTNFGTSEAASEPILSKLRLANCILNADRFIVDNLQGVFHMPV